MTIYAEKLKIPVVQLVHLVLTKWLVGEEDIRLSDGERRVRSEFHGLLLKKDAIEGSNQGLGRWSKEIDSWVKLQCLHQEVFLRTEQKEKRLEHKKRYYAKRKFEIGQYKKDYYRRNRERGRQIKGEYHESDRVSILGYKKQYPIRFSKKMRLRRNTVY